MAADDRDGLARHMAVLLRCADPGAGWFVSPREHLAFGLTSERPAREARRGARRARPIVRQLARKSNQVVRQIDVVVPVAQDDTEVSSGGSGQQQLARGFPA